MSREHAWSSRESEPITTPAGHERGGRGADGQDRDRAGRRAGRVLTSLGTRSGLWAALAGAGPLTTEEVAAKVLVDPALVREWLRAQAAGGYLDYDPVRGTFQLPDAVAAAIHEGPGGALVDAAATMMSSMGEGFGAFSEAFSTGQGFGWHQRSAEHWHGTDAFTRVALPTELIAAAIDQLGDVASALTGGGSVVDVGCGYGTPTLGIAAAVSGGHRAGHRLPRRLDRARSGRGRRDRGRKRPVRGRRGHRAGRRRYDLITFFDSLHDMGDAAAGAARGQGGGRTHGCAAGVRADGRRRRPGQPQPGRADVLRRVDARVHAQCGLAADDHLVGATGRPSRRAAPARPGRRRPASLGSAGPRSRHR